MSNCPKCNRPLKLRNGKYGEFWGCTGYPDCQYIFKETKGGYPQPSPEAQNRPQTNEKQMTTELVLIETMDALIEELKTLNANFEAMRTQKKSG